MFFLCICSSIGFEFHFVIILFVVIYSSEFDFILAFLHLTFNCLCPPFNNAFDNPISLIPCYTSYPTQSWPNAPLIPPIPIAAQQNKNTFTNKPTKKSTSINIYNKKGRISPKNKIHSLNKIKTSLSHDNITKTPSIRPKIDHSLIKNSIV